MVPSSPSIDLDATPREIVGAKPTPWRWWIVFEHALANVLIGPAPGGDDGGAPDLDLGNVVTVDGTTVSALLSAGYDFTIQSPFWGLSDGFAYEWSNVDFWYNSEPIYVGPNHSYIDPATGLVWDLIHVPIAFAIDAMSITYRGQFFTLVITAVPGGGGGGGGSGSIVADSTTDVDVLGTDQLTLGRSYQFVSLPMPNPGTYRVLAPNRTITTACDLNSYQANGTGRDSLLWPMRKGDVFLIGYASVQTVGDENIAQALGPCWISIEQAGPWVPNTAPSGS